MMGIGDGGMTVHNIVAKIRNGGVVKVRKCGVDCRNTAVGVGNCRVSVRDIVMKLRNDRMEIHDTPLRVGEVHARVDFELGLGADG